MAFSTTNAIVLTGAVVTVGRWAEGKPLSIKVVTGGAIAAVSLALVSEVAPQVGTQLGIVVVVVALFTYFPPIAEKAGLIQNAPHWGEPTGGKQPKLSRAPGGRF